MVGAHGVEPLVVQTAELATESSAFHATDPLLADAAGRPDAIYAPLDRLAAGAMLARAGTGWPCRRTCSWPRASTARPRGSRRRP